MLFNSFLFLAFFTVLVVLYYVIPHRFRWLFLLAASLYFYATFDLRFVWVLLAITLIAYLVGLAIGAVQNQGGKKAILALGLVAVLGALAVFKYYNFFVQSLSAVLQLPSAAGAASSGSAVPLLPKLELLALPGLSFYSFACASYLVDVYRARIAPERHIGRFALYVSFFPKLLMGPIERATTFLPQLLSSVRFNSAGVTEGLQLILWGLFKKVVVADRLAAFVDAAYQRPGMASPADLLIASYFFAFQIYCDFSGYTDIAIGIAKVLGINLMENFRRPYFAKGAGEFWSERWHLSLTRWFRDYMYIPMGGSRVPPLRLYFNLLAVFLVSGLWHGANWTFVIWGGLNGLYVVLGRATSGIRQKIGQAVRIPSAVGSFLSGLVTFHLILLTWVFFRAASLSDALTVFSRVAKALPTLPTLLVRRPYTSEFFISLAVIGVLLLVEALDEWRPFWQGLRARPIYLRWAVYFVLLLSLIVIGSWKMRQFVYMQF